MWVIVRVSGLQSINNSVLVLMRPKFSVYQLLKRQLANRNSSQYDTSREGQLRAVAHRLGMDYSEFEEYSSHPLLSEFNLFKAGRNRTITNILKTTEDSFDTKLQIFDYRFESGYGKSSRTYNQTVFFVQSKNLALPEFTMEPESIFHKIASYAFGTQDIDFERHPKFSGNYLLKGEDEEYIRFMMNEQLLHFFSSNTGWYMEGINFYLIFYKINTRFKARSIKQFYEQGKGIYESMAKEMKWEPLV